MLLSLFRRGSPRIDDSDFGLIRFHRRPRPGWENDTFAFGGHTEIQLLLDADEEGPTEVQRKFMRELKARYPDLEPRILAAIRARFAAEASLADEAKLHLRSIFIPTFDGPEESVWRLWYDPEGQDLLSYGVEMKDWDTIVPFAED